MTEFNPSDTDLRATLEQYCATAMWSGVVYAFGETYWIVGAKENWRRREGAVAWDQIYEARVFDGRHEIRWWQEDLPRGCAARVDVPTQGVRRSWLLWGRVVANDGSWLRLAESRIGSVWIPRPEGEQGERHYVGLIVTERRDHDEFGNVYVVDEVLTRLHWRDGDSAGKSGGQQ